MSISRGLVISLGTSVLGFALLFLYFRNRMGVMERKVDVMFDLIQNHNQQQQPPVEYEEESVPNIQFSVREKTPTEEREDDNRIAVSDDEASDDAFDSDDSEEVDDDDDNNVVSLNLEEENIEINDIKTITLDGTENPVDNGETDSLDEIDDDDDDNEDNISTDNQENKVNNDADEDNNDNEDITVIKKIDYSTLKVSELKVIAEERELSGYKSLKKSALINLLKTNE